MILPPDRKPPPRGLSVLLGAAELYPLVLVEAAGALGLLLGKRRCPNERYEEVLYFRIVAGEAYSIFLSAVELDTVDGYAIARVADGPALIHDPSLHPYEVRRLSGEVHRAFADRIVAQDLGWIEQTIADLFAAAPGFSRDEDGRLVCPANYGTGFDHFIGRAPFVAPLKAKPRE